MSEENQNPGPPKPTIKTSAVPLKKETVRITLRPQVPDAPPPPATVPLRPAPPPSAAGAPPPPPRPPVAAGAPPPAPATRPVAPPPPAAVGSKTIPLTQAPPPRPATPAAPTSSLSAAPATQALPKATVKLTRPTPTGPMPSPTTSIAPTLRTAAADDDDGEVNETPLNIMGWIGLAGSLAAVFAVLACWDNEPLNVKPLSNITGSTAQREEKTAWLDNSQVRGKMLPVDYSPFDRKIEGATEAPFTKSTLSLDPIPALPERTD